MSWPYFFLHRDSALCLKLNTWVRAKFFDVRADIYNIWCNPALELPVRKVSFCKLDKCCFHLQAAVNTLHRVGRVSIWCKKDSFLFLLFFWNKVIVVVALGFPHWQIDFYECATYWSLGVTAAKCVDYVFQGTGSEEALVSEDCSLWPLWPRLLPMGGPQKAQILNLLSFSPQACWCILQRSLQSSGGEMRLSILIMLFNT